MRNSRFITVIMILGWCIAGARLAHAQAALNGFVLGAVGRYGTSAEETVEGKRSVVGVYQGPEGFSQFLKSDPKLLHLIPGATYTVTFKYRILATPDKGFEMLFFSPEGAAQNIWVPSKVFGGMAGDRGEISHTAKLEAFDDYHVIWNIVGEGRIAIDSVRIRQEVDSIPVAEWGFEAPAVRSGLLPFALSDEVSFASATEESIYMLRNAAARDLDGDGCAEVILTFSTYPENLLQPIRILRAKAGVIDATAEFFPGGAPALKNASYAVFADLDRDGREDIVFAEAGLDREPWTGSRLGIALKQADGTFRDVSDKIPEFLWETRSYATAAGDLDRDGVPEVICPDQLTGENTALLTWKQGRFVAKRDWIKSEMWAWPGSLHANNSLAISDLDADGWTDIIVGGGWGRPNLRLVFGGPSGFLDPDLVVLPDGIFGHAEDKEWNAKDTYSAQGADIIGLLVADLDTDGLADIFSLHEQALLFKAGANTGTVAPEFDSYAKNGGTRYANMALQVFRNKGARVFEDISLSSSCSLLGWRFYNSLVPMDMNGDGFLDVVGGYLTKGHGTQKSGYPGTTLFLNDGTGAFHVVEGSELFPTMKTDDYSYTTQLGLFVPTRVALDRLEGVFVAAYKDASLGSGMLVARKGVSESAIGTGPGLADSARLGFPGFNEYYYLRTHSDAMSAVKAGQYPSGLEHYKAVGIRRGYQAFAANARVHGTAGRDTLILAVKKAQVKLRKAGGAWLLTDTTGKYGTLRIDGIEVIRFLDRTMSL
jgi:hypothetical protein